MVGVFCFDKEGRFLSINDAGLRQIGYGEDYARRRLRPWDIKPAVPQSHFWPWIEKNLGLDVVTLHQRNDGILIPVRLNVRKTTFGFEAAAARLLMPHHQAAAVVEFVRTLAC